MSQTTGSRATDVEQWPLWHEPSGSPFRDDAAERLENMKAGLAQVSAIVPFVGPGVAFIANSRGSFARREAAKAFNGQIAAVLALAAALGPIALVYFLLNPTSGTLSFSDFPVAVLALLALWAGQAAIGSVMAFRGRDWTTPLSRVFRVRLLSEDRSDRWQQRSLR